MTTDLTPSARLLALVEELEKKNQERIKETEYSDSGVYVPDAHDAVHDDIPFLLLCARGLVEARGALDYARPFVSAYGSKDEESMIKGTLSRIDEILAKVPTTK